MVEFRQSCEEGIDIDECEELFKAVSHLPGGEYKESIADVAVPEAAADETEDIQQEDTEAVETLDETAEEADPFSTGEEGFHRRR